MCHVIVKVHHPSSRDVKLNKERGTPPTARPEVGSTGDHGPDTAAAVAAAISSCSFRFHTSKKERSSTILPKAVSFHFSGAVNFFNSFT